MLTSLPTALSAEANLHARLSTADTRSGEFGAHFTHSTNGRSFHALRLRNAEYGAPLAILVPLDATGLDRMEAATQLLRALLDSPSFPDNRMTRQQRRRARQMLQAVDGHHSGATYREIAETLYGVRRVRAEHWKTSSLRDSVIGLVKGGLTMIAGGYRHLLRHRRRK